MTPTLPGSRVRLEPLAHTHAAALLRAAGQDPSLYALSFVPTTAAAVDDYIATALAWRDAGTAIPFATIRLRDNAVIGSTRFFDIQHFGEFQAAEIGYTWLCADAIRTGINTEAKLLMLAHAFETLGLERICFHTDERNERSRNALAGIGATFEGVLRAYRLATDNTPRNSARFSILKAEWPSVKAALQRKLTAR